MMVWKYPPRSFMDGVGWLTPARVSVTAPSVSAAVASLADACQGLGAVYGETGMECGEAYFYYGKALLELARMETGVIQNGMDGGKAGILFFMCRFKGLLSPR